MDRQSEMIGLLKGLQFEIKQLQSEVAELRNEVKELGWIKVYMEYIPELTMAKMVPYFKELEKGQPKSRPRPRKYEKFQPTRKKGWGWKEQVLYTLFMEDRPLQSWELVEIHVQLEIRAGREERHIQKDVGKNLTALVKAGRVVKYKPEGLGKYFYCLPGWMDKKGELKHEYFGRGAFL